MTGIIALQGGGPFVANFELDTALLAEVSAETVMVLPTADAFEHPERLVAESMNWAERLGVQIEALMVLRRSQALDEGAARELRHVRALYIVGDQPLHLRSVVKDTPLWDAVRAMVADGGLVVGIGACASALCDPLVDPRGGAFTLGLGLVPGVAFVHESEHWSHERLHRTLELANTPVVCAPTGSALVLRPTGWESHGEVVVHGVLP
jgi:cyanophycinase